MAKLSKETLWLAFACIIAFYWGLSGYALLNNNEGLYAQIAFEMLTSGNFTVPTLNGVSYIEKPPMLYWLIAGSYSLFGKTVWAARFVPATFGCLTVLSLVLFLRRLGRQQEGLAAGTLLATSLGFAIFSRMVFFDGLLTAFFTFALLSFYLWDKTAEKKWHRLFYVFLACALLTKGFLTVLLAGLIATIHLSLKRRHFMDIFTLWDTIGVLTFILIAAPWHIMASLQQEGFAWFYFINEHVLRFLDMREPRDYYRGPFYYYLIRIPAYFAPWTLLLPFSGAQTTKPKDASLRPFLWLWFGITLAFFTLSRAKANYYMVLGMPPAALLLVDYFYHRQRFALFTKIATLLSAALLMTATFIAPQHTDKISAKRGAEFLRTQNQSRNIYLFKRFEHISSFIFYYGRPLPIADSESADLAFGSKLEQGKVLFQDFNDILNTDGEKIFVLHPRDEKEFRQRTKGQSFLLYKDKNLRIYKIP